MRKNDPNAKKASPEAVAGQNAKKCRPGNKGWPKNEKINQKKQKKTANNAKHANAPGNGQFFRFCMVPATTANFTFFAFFAFRPASVSRLAFFLHFGRPLLPGLRLFLHFGRSQDLGVASFRILAGLGRCSLTNAKMQC